MVRVETADGLDGAAFGLTRGAPLDAVVAELLAPPLLGRDARRTEALRAAWGAALPHHAPEGLVLRGRSLIELAAWDIKGKAAGEPVWRLLGGGREAAPVLLVEGYEIAGESDEAFAHRIHRAVEEGYACVKLANVADPARMTRRLELVRELTGPEPALTVDVGYAWGDHGAAVELAQRWGALGRTSIEDPLHGHEVARLARLRAAVSAPIAVGDEVTNAVTAAALVDAGAVDVLRVDATCLGGFEGLAALRRRATAAGVAISAHVYPELHRHFACAFAEPGARSRRSGPTRRSTRPRSSSHRRRSSSTPRAACASCALPPSRGSASRSTGSAWSGAASPSVEGGAALKASCGTWCPTLGVERRRPA